VNGRVNVSITIRHDRLIRRPPRLAPGLCPHLAAAEASALTAGEHFTELAGQITKALEQLSHLSRTGLGATTEALRSRLGSRILRTAALRVSTLLRTLKHLEEHLQHLLDHLQHLIGIDPLAAIGRVPGNLFGALGLVILVVKTVHPVIGVECNATDLHLESPSLIPDELIE
jgi:hypothetical protein